MSSLPEPRIASWTMQQPLPVTLLHVQVSRNANGTTTLSCSHRFRSKFVTIVIHKPERPSVPEAYQRAMAAQAHDTAGGPLAAQLATMDETQRAECVSARMERSLENAVVRRG